MNKKFMLKRIILSAVFILAFVAISAQDVGRLSGNFQFDAQSYRADSLIGAAAVAVSLLSRSMLSS